MMVTKGNVVRRSVVVRVLVGSNPTRHIFAPLVKWLRHRLFTAVTWVRIPYGVLGEKKYRELVAVRRKTSTDFEP